MNFVSSLLEALESLTSNKVRTALTMLGIIIGVGAVIAMLAIGNGTEQAIVGEIEGIGTNLLFVMTNYEDVTNPEPLTIRDAEAIADPIYAPSVAAAAPVIRGQAELTAGGNVATTGLVGVTEEYRVVQNVELSEGEFFTGTQITGLASAVILGTNVAEDLFGRSDGLIGETVRVSGQPFRVVGILKKEGGSEFGNSPDDQILVPLTTAQTRLLPRTTKNQVDLIYVSAIDADSVQQAEDQISLILRDRHKIKLGEDDFNIISQEMFLDMASTVTGVFTVFLGGVAGISLLVGGIGIMNIMLVSVTERTKEIGLRKAVGAKKKDILTQFLIESSLLSVIGGIIGIILGWLLSLGIGRIAAASDFILNPAITINSVLLATLFSAAVGLFFGIYPANRASQLEPIEALRSE
ncbi:MAG: ABC transporter permease [Anaerolineales bacterium]|nr:ABC transporter permease [Anaerolineales bacterium]